MSKALLVHITVYDNDDADKKNEVQQQFIHTYTGSYGYEVERMFTRIGERMAKVIDEQYEP